MKFSRKRRCYAWLFAAMIIVSACLTFTGCLNPISLDNYGYVVTIAADKGKEKKYEVILELQRERSNEGAESEGGAIILSEEGDTLFEAVNRISYRTAYPLNFTRTHVFIFGEDMAREGLIQDFFRLSFDTLRIRQSAIVMVVQCTLREYLGGLAANNNPNLSKFQDDMLYDQINTGLIAVTDLSTFLEACDGGFFDPVTPLGYYNENIITDSKQKTSASEGDNPFADADDTAPLGGTMSLTTAAALFNGWKMTGILTPHDTQIMNLGRGEFRSGTITYDIDDDTAAALLVKLDKRSVRAEMDTKGIRLEMDIKLEISVEQDPTGSIGSNWDEGEREKLNEYFTNELNRVFEICRKSGCDAMGVGKYVLKQFSSVEDMEAFDWKKSYSKAEIVFNVQLELDDYYIATSRQ